MKHHTTFRIIVLTAITSITLFFLMDIEKEVMASSHSSASGGGFDFTSEEIRETAEQYLNIPYRWGGTTTSGFDCSGYVYKVFTDLGIEIPRTSQSQYEVGEPVSKDELQPGDLVFFNTSGTGVSHVGIYFGDGKFIHSQSYKGVSFTDIDDPKYWGARYVGAKRVANVGEALQSVVGPTTESAF